jgi:hypothetical protein
MKKYLDKDAVVKYRTFSTVINLAQREVVETATMHARRLFVNVTLTGFK